MHIFYFSHFVLITVISVHGIINTVTDLMKALPGNSSVNSPTHTRGQQYSRSVFYVVRIATVDFYC
jgi:hypothetical protein